MCGAKWAPNCVLEELKHAAVCGAKRAPSRVLEELEHASSIDRSDRTQRAVEERLHRLHPMGPLHPVTRGMLCEVGSGGSPHARAFIERSQSRRSWR